MSVKAAFDCVVGVLAKDIAECWLTRQAQLAAFLASPMPFRLAALIGFVAQILLVLAHLAELIEPAAHLPHPRVSLARPRDPQVFKDVLQLLQHFPRIRAVARTQHLLHLVEHSLQVFGADRTAPAVKCRGIIPVVLVVLLGGELLQKFIHCGAQIVGELADFIFRSVALQGIAQLLLGGAEIAFGLGEIAILDAQRHLPEIIGDFDEIAVAMRRIEPIECHPQSKIDTGGRVEHFRRDHQGLERVCRPRLILGGENQIAALFGKRAGERLDKRLLRQRDFDGIATAFIASFIARGQRHFNLRAGPWVFGKIGRCLGLAAEVRWRRQRKQDMRRLDERTCGGMPAWEHRLGEMCLRAGNAVIVGDAVSQRHRSPCVKPRRPGQRNRRQLIQNGMNVERAEWRAGMAKGQRCIATQNQASFAIAIPLAVGRFGGGGAGGGQADLSVSVVVLSGLGESTVHLHVKIAARRMNDDDRTAGGCDLL